ncbi:sensor histidine kinase [Cohnella sp.]|uniref:sensor histidine kinase n=1 Tax=Cohnella sp. TaxID=1883426 RepID=UPI0035650724
MERFRKQSLIRQVLYLILIMLIILLISFTISNTIAKRIIEKKVTDTAGKILLQVQEKMDIYYSDMEGISNFLLYSPTVQTYLSTGDAISKVLMHNEIISIASNAMTLKQNIRGIQLYDKKGQLAASIGAETGQPAKHPVQTAEYSELIDNPSNTRTYYSITFPIYNLKSTILRDYNGTSVFAMDLDNFSSLLKNAKITENSRLLLLDQNNKIMADEGNALQTETLNVEEWQKDKRFIVQTIMLPRTGWKLISAIPRNELLQDLNTVQRLNIATYVVMLFMLSLFLALFFTRILKPVKALMDFMKSYPRMGGESRIHVVTHNEMGVLALNLNRMLDKIDNLSKEIQLTQKQMYEIEIAKKQMEISAYRNQINPHFLYNTLECIRAMAFYYKVQDIADISTSLSNMFRYSVKGSDFVTIQDEISHVKEYAKIIEFRFMGRIQVIVEADEHLLELRTIKMLLQPIVENAVFHGLEKKIDNGTVRIEVHKTPQNQVQYVIVDNGYGMEDKQLTELNDRLRQFDSQGQMTREAKHGIGLSNIYRRIKLLYGDEADMFIESKPGLGTTVRITFPLQDYTEQLEVI